MSTSIPLILASKSKPRRDVLFSAGICPTIRVSNVRLRWNVPPPKPGFASPICRSSGE